MALLVISIFRDIMNELCREDFINATIFRIKKHYPLFGNLELTYRCNLNCIHCYCNGSQNREGELSTKEWKGIINELQKHGCICFAFTGGDPLIRDDFLELYLHAKKKGFIIILFTNGLAFNKEIINYLLKFPPYSIEITLNGITRKTYEGITQTAGSFKEAIENIKLLAKNKLPLIIKTNCIKQNKHEVVKIKKWTENVLGKPAKDKSYFRCDMTIFPCLNGSKHPLDLRLSFDEMIEMQGSDIDLWNAHQEFIQKAYFGLSKIKSLYRCSTILGNFFITPYGGLKFCCFSDKFSLNLRENSFKDCYKALTNVLSLKFKTNSKCRSCLLRTICFNCPAKAFLETGDEESPVDYYCQLAKEMAKDVMMNYIKPKNGHRAV